jgi:hypothetical protein
MAVGFTIPTKFTLQDKMTGPLGAVQMTADALQKYRYTPDSASAFRNPGIEDAFNKWTCRRINHKEQSYGKVV